jgi:hypothetical protein
MMDTEDFPYPEHPYRVIRDGYIYAGADNGIRYLAHNGRLYPIYGDILFIEFSFRSVPNVLFELHKDENYPNVVKKIKELEAT